MAQKADRSTNGKFAKGHKRFGGRVKGQKNGITVDIKEALLAAGEYLGGEGGLTQFFIDIGEKDPKTVGNWIVDLLPRDINKPDSRSESPSMVINIVGVASGHHLSKAECQAAMYGELPMIEHAPLVIDNADDD